MEPAALHIAGRNKLSIDRINRHADEHGVAVARVPLSMSIDRSRMFTCPTLSPLWHDPVFRELTASQQLRYNQLVGLMQNELICFFEQELAGNVLPSVLKGEPAMSRELANSLQHFLEEERQHTPMFRRLNRLAEPSWYAASDYHILRLPRIFLAALRAIARRPFIFPMIFWIMLMMEERTLMISRRYAAMDPQELDPLFAATYRAHAEDEVRHVQLDWHLLEQFYQDRPTWVRKMNARLLEWMLFGLFLKPRRANVRIIGLLIEEFPELTGKRNQLVRAVHGLANNPGYRQMMYSAEATPIARSLFDRLPEFQALKKRLFAFEQS